MKSLNIEHSSNGAKTFRGNVSEIFSMQLGFTICEPLNSVITSVESFKMFLKNVTLDIVFHFASHSPSMKIKL